MGVIDKFLNAMKLNDEESFGEDDYLDEDYEEEDQEVQPKKHILKKLEEEDEEEDLIQQSLAASPERASASRTSRPKVVRTNSSSKVSPMRPKKSGTEKSGEMEVCVIKPRSMEDAREITETLLSGRTVILNLEGLDLEIAQRIIDFTSGAAFAINGNLQKVSNYIFLVTPTNVDISGDLQDLLNTSFDASSMKTRF